MRLPDGRHVVPGNDWSALADARPIEQPTVSVVVPYYRAQAELDLVLAGLAAQTHPASRLQVVVADDGSPEPPRVPGGGALDVTVVRQDDRGFRAAAARNLGARAAEGEVLLFLDGDTVPSPSYVAELAALPALLPDALVTGRRRHADLAGWTPDRLLAWFAGGPGPQELTEPAWLREAGSLLDADDRSYRFVISAVMGLTRSLFTEVGGFAETFPGYGGEDWELAHRLLTAGAVLAHRERAVAWHDGPDWGLRGDDPVAARREKNLETRALARLLPDPAARGLGGWWPYPDVVATMAAGADDDATVLGVRSLLAAGLDLQVWLPDRGAEAADLFDGDPRVHAGDPPPDVLARCRTQVTLTGPLLWSPGGLVALVARVHPGGVGRVTGTVDDVDITVAATRALRRSARWRPQLGPDLLDGLFGSVTVDPDAQAPGPHPDLAHHLPRLG